MSNVKLRVRILLWAVMLCAGVIGTAFGGTTGKIAGKVTDANGVPLVGATVTVTGTRLGATTDLDGAYVILQVPPGTQEIVAQLIGYRPTTMTGLRVSADLTTQSDFTLTEEAIDVGAITVTAERPPIEIDVTGSRTIVNAARVAEVPVNQMLDVLDYQPGVNVVRDNELQIRGGGPSQIRFQVDGVDRTDGVTGKGFTLLNQVTVSEVTLLTGGFNAEYGNVRSGMVNVVVKEGSERGSLKPWVAGAMSAAPAQLKHFGPNAYSENQYDYWLLTKTDSALTGGAVYWPDLYEETSSDAAFMSYVESNPSSYVAFEGWNKRASEENSKGLRSGPAYAHNGWTAEDMMTAWTWEANMNGEVWEYANEPDLQADLALGVGLPGHLGGMIFGYTYNKEMTAVPALIPYYRDQSFESKLTLTPMDNLKLSASYMRATSVSTGASAGESGVLTDSESQNTDAATGASDPVSLRSASYLVKSVNESSGSNSRLNLSLNGPLHGTFDQFSATLTYTLGANTYASASFGRSESSWKIERDLPRADSQSETAFGEDASWRVGSSWSYGTLIATLFSYPGVSAPTSLDYATNPDNYVLANPFNQPNPFSEPPGETVFVTNTYVWENRSWEPARGDKNEATNDTTFHVTIVSPQGWIGTAYQDLAGHFTIGGGGELTMEAGGVQQVARGDITHVAGRHTLKTGLEYIARDLEYTQDMLTGAFDISGTANSFMRDYGGAYPAAQPKILGFYAQDKYESDGMIANLGFRIERFDAGHPSWFYDDMFNSNYFGEINSRPLLRELVIAAGWDTVAWGTSTIRTIDTNFYTINDSLDGNAPLPSDVVRAWPSNDNKIYWQMSPRFGVSHPVSHRTKFFFNYGVFYSMQKSTYMFGFRGKDGRPGGSRGHLQELYNANLRLASTTMYEVGVEHVLSFGTVFKVTGYAKYNEDQASSLHITGIGGTSNYTAFRNTNYEDIRGYEIQLSRSSGRFLNGAVSYEASGSRTGEVAVKTISPNRDSFESPHLPDVRSTPANGYFRAFVSLGTPTDWGKTTGGWSLGVEYTWSKGGEELYNPNLLAAREIPDENYLRWANADNVNMKLSKRLSLPGGRHISAYVDISNVFNTKHLNSSGVSDWDAYLAYIYTRNQLGEDVKIGDESTFYVLNEPYKVDPDAPLWNQPISPSTDWIQFLNPRFYRFGIRFDL